MAAAPPPVLREVPRLDARACSPEDVRRIYDETQVLLLEHLPAPASGGSYGLGHLWQLWARHADAVAQGWTAEGTASAASSPQTLLGGGDSATGAADAADRWYASVVLDQRRSPQALAELLAAAPPLPRQLAELHAEPHCWLFFGRNASSEPMVGRPEHRDDVRTEGTWHVQLAGSKVWLLRPFPDQHEWEPCPQPDVPDGRLRVVVEAGSALLVNTRLYLHQTSIPGGQPGRDALSMSLARDFRLGGSSSRRPGAHAAAKAAISEVEGARQEFSSVLCTVELCAWCGTPSSRDAAGVCGCLCCTMRRKDRRTDGRAADGGHGLGAQGQAPLFGTSVPRGLLKLSAVWPSTSAPFKVEPGGAARIMPWASPQEGLARRHERRGGRSLLVDRPRPRRGSEEVVTELGAAAAAAEPELLRVRVRVVRNCRARAGSGSQGGGMHNVC